MVPARLRHPGRAPRVASLTRAALILLAVATAPSGRAAAQAIPLDGALPASPGAILLPAQPLTADTSPVLLGGEPLPTIAPAPGEAVLTEPRPTWEFLPLHRLWQPPLASRRAPRMYVVGTTLDEYYTHETLDTAIGAVVGLFRYTPPGHPDAPWQLDFFAVHFSRWSDRAHAVVSDYRYGLPITWATGGWQAKVGYEHTSTHLGDDYIKTFQRYKERYVRDEIVFGLSYRWFNQLRLYGEFGYAFSMGCSNYQGRDRFEWGLEWSKQAPTGWCGQPFAAFDMDLRPEQDYEANMCLQLGWQWIPPSQVYSFRFAAEFYSGYAPYGQLYQVKEEWAGLGLFLDF